MEKAEDVDSTNTQSIFDADTSSSKYSSLRPSYTTNKWRWIVLFAAFLVNVIIDGFTYVFGVLLTHLVEYFDATRSDTAWVGSLFCAVPLLCGPIANIISKRIGIKYATILGGMIATIGFICASVSDSLISIYLTYGVIAGFGVSMPYLNSVVMVAVYFDKNRGFASGISECGTGVGTFLFAPFLEMCINEYGWRGAILIFAGIISNLIVCGTIFRLQHADFYSENSSSTVDDTLKELSASRFSLTVSNRLNKSMHLLSSKFLRDVDFTDDLQMEQNKSQELISSNLELPHYVNCRRFSVSCPNLVCNEIKTNTKDDTSNIFSSPGRKLIDLSVLRNPMFFFYACTSFIIYVWIDTPYVYIVDRTSGLGISKTSAAFLVSIIGIVHTFGNIIFGFVADRPTVNSIVLFCVNIIITGICVAVIPFCLSYIPTAVVCGLFGLFSAVVEVTSCVILVHILGIQKLPDAYGINMFLQGIASLIGPPFAGFLYDVSQSYDNTFLAAGISLAVSAYVEMMLLKQDNDELFQSSK
ncbi:hypothetical protein KUTeg_004278 [Tegillarca granosa]|uniref:Major facilitator superfamily (MFS) profile domain-containing protein n=1 Tax=Tegillarca granosa TaxID=220873 RepID=A0ABQ9FR89_TEGGR|nr:hypothetical protein KUTeg_004278 [Tegillarca granosa]